MLIVELAKYSEPGTGTGTAGQSSLPMVAPQDHPEIVPSSHSPFQSPKGRFYYTLYYHESKLILPELALRSTLRDL